ncbi:hypothetical protein CEXT_693971 [Caerostris extrusa]|uniref:Uncharacterized protein n=1 Tax=Caerostris extrusa TaxID=172846 RepID=A0AAV4PLR5_CAEEX|nr:hypothetical protein CEXT_693971 [Caerostris extrusa]
MRSPVPPFFIQARVVMICIEEKRDVVYVFVFGDQGTGKTTLINSVTTRRISDPLLPSFQYVSESDRMTDMGMITLRLLELNRGHLTSPEISQICRTAKHVLLFVFAIYDLHGFNFVRLMINVRKAFGWSVPAVMLGTQTRSQK